MVNHLLNMDSIDVWELFFPRGSGQYYRPLLYLTFFADKHLWGLVPSFMHLENIILHLCSSILVFAIMRHAARFCSSGYAPAPLLAALLFGLHPIATEPVNWISGRTDVLALVFILVMFLALIASMHSVSPVMMNTAGAVVLLCGCLCKETALFVLPAVLLWIVSASRELGCVWSSGVRRIIFLIYCCAGGVYLWMRWSALSRGDKIVSTVSHVAMNSNSSFELLDVIRVGIKVVGFYTKKLMMPLPLNFAIVGISPLYIVPGFLVCIGLVYCLYRLDLVSCLLISSFCLLSPSLLLPVLKITWTPIAERYAYMAAAPFIMAGVLLFARFVSSSLRTTVVTTMAAIVLVCAGGATASRNLVWQDNLSLYQDTVSKSPGFHAARNELAIALHENGRKEDAYSLLQTNGTDDFQPASLNKVRVFINKGKLPEARSLLLGLKRSDREALELLVMIDELRYKEASNAAEHTRVDRDLLETNQQLLKISGDPFFHYRSGLVQLRLGDKAGAKQSFLSAWTQAPLNSHYRSAAKKLSEQL